MANSVHKSIIDATRLLDPRLAPSRELAVQIRQSQVALASHILDLKDYGKFLSYRLGEVEDAIRSPFVIPNYDRPDTGSHPPLCSGHELVHPVAMGRRSRSEFRSRVLPVLLGVI